MIEVSGYAQLESWQTENGVVEGKAGVKRLHRQINKKEFAEYDLGEKVYERGDRTPSLHHLQHPYKLHLLGQWWNYASTEVARLLSSTASLSLSSLYLLYHCHCVDEVFGLADRCCDVVRGRESNAHCNVMKPLAKQLQIKIKCLHHFGSA